jgi:hypothetical protein
MPANIPLIVAALFVVVSLVLWLIRTARQKRADRDAIEARLFWELRDREGEGKDV